jgi:DNA-binding response OmpR family regulator
VEIVRETILLVEDEAGIRALVRKILRREHYQVLEAGSAEEALAMASSASGRIDLLVTDVMLPGASGRELAEKIRETRQDLRVLYISGYTDDDAVRTGAIPPGSKFLQKPFTLGALVGKVRESLGYGAA